MFERLKRLTSRKPKTHYVTPPVTREDLQEEARRREEARARVRETQAARVEARSQALSPQVEVLVLRDEDEEVPVVHTKKEIAVKTKTKTKTSAQHIKRGGKHLEGRPVRKGDVLYNRRSGAAVTVAGFKEQGKKVRIKPAFGKERVVMLSTIGSGYTRTSLTYRSW